MFVSRFARARPHRRAGRSGADAPGGASGFSLPLIRMLSSTPGFRAAAGEIDAAACAPPASGRNLCRRRCRFLCEVGGDDRSLGGREGSTSSPYGSHGHRRRDGSSRQRPCAAGIRASCDRDDARRRGSRCRSSPDASTRIRDRGVGSPACSRSGRDRRIDSAGCSARGRRSTVCNRDCSTSGQDWSASDRIGCRSIRERPSGRPGCSRSDARSANPSCVRLPLDVDDEPQDHDRGKEIPIVEEVPQKLGQVP